MLHVTNNFPNKMRNKKQNKVSHALKSARVPTSYWNFIRYCEILWKSKRIFEINDYQIKNRKCYCKWSNTRMESLWVTCKGEIPRAAAANIVRIHIPLECWMSFSGGVVVFSTYGNRTWDHHHHHDNTRVQIMHTYVKRLHARVHKILKIISSCITSHGRATWINPPRLKCHLIRQGSSVRIVCKIKRFMKKKNQALHLINTSWVQKITKATKNTPSWCS